MRILFLLLSSFVFPAVVFANATVPIGQFSKGVLSGWQVKEFHQQTNYTLVSDAKTQVKFLEARSHNSASCLFYKKRIDLEKTPWLHWSWKVLSALENVDESSKSGDDFVARLYVVIDGGLFFWKTIALNYVWSSSHEQGESWLSPYTSNATLLAVASGNDDVGVWKKYKRNVVQDFINFTGKNVRYIDGLAIMTDTDNSQQQAVAYFGDIFFTAE